ncbi:phosphatase and actin regulator 2 isoform X4 [Choloepus didactylus]|uniref:phosphatase and actin regulator 2 isoform X4 n=1 Tax=Choloepus didactylus TaxID=27675 RepID=UPI00189FFE49|nr:phosphatase and actin regulator 2 isoform X4 [Choloepus didactylus]
MAKWPQRNMIKMPLAPAVPGGLEESGKLLFRPCPREPCDRRRQVPALEKCRDSCRGSHLPSPTCCRITVDGLDKASIANADGPAAGAQTPPFKRKGRLSTIGKIFKPWKWRRKKTSDKFRETSAVLERKISTRQSREELIRRGVLKELPDEDGDVTVNFESSNGHLVPIGEETSREENVVRPEEGDGPASRKATLLHDQAEDGKAGSSHSKRTTGSKVSASPSTPSTSSRPRASKETVSSKTGTVGTTKGKKKPGKPSASRPSADATSSSSTDLPGDLLEIGGEGLQPELIVPEGQTPGKAKPGDPAPPEAPLPPAPAQPPEDGCLAAPAPPAVLLSEGTDPPTPALDTGPPHWTEGPTSRATVHPDASSPGGGESAGCFTTSAELGKATPRLLVPGLEDGGPRESLASDSDSDGPVLYTDDDDDEDEDGSGESALASKIRRRDTLAIKLGHRPSKKELEDKNILQRTSEEERQEIRQQIGAKLVRRLSQRPTTEELEQRNILKQKNEEEEQEAKMELKRRLSRKLSLRPTVAELQARRILRFNEYVEVTDSPEYDRRADKPWVRLTPADKAAIRKELNEFKSTEMEVHEESRQFTRFHRP